MRFIRRDPHLGYVDTQLWAPKSAVNVESVRSALTFLISDKVGGARYLQLYSETDDHIIVPRAFWKAGELNFDVVDCRPDHFEPVGIISHIKLDFKNPTRTTQKDASDAILNSDGGILQLACVSGGTVLNLNRNGKGFKMTIREACCRFLGAHRYKWNTEPTYIRCKMGERIGLNLVEAFVYRGKRMTWTITLADGKRLRVTSDHEILTDSGWKSIDAGLDEYDSVIVDSGQKKWGKKEGATGRQHKAVYRRLHWYPSHPYAHKNGNKTGPRSGRKQEWTIEEHRAVAEASINGLSLEEYRTRFRQNKTEGLFFINPAEFIVHHKDENPRNNNPNNLEVVPAEDHLRLCHPDGADHFGYGKPTKVDIISIEQYGHEDVYDVVCADPHHNFVANGVVVHNCGLGKTVVALHVAAVMAVPTLIVVNNTNLMGQWQKEIERHLEVPDGVGLIQGDVCDWKKPIVLSTYQTLASRADSLPEELRRWFGLGIYDEGHHSAAPWFSRSVDLVYGMRLILTATPDRTDGAHVVYNAHVGDVLYKDLKQELTPEFQFLWTGLKLDMNNPQTRAAVVDKNGELHLSKLAGHFGQWQERLNFILDEVRRHEAAGRKTLVLSNSVAELVNLLALYNGRQDLYSDIPIPTAADFGSSLVPDRMNGKARARRELELKRAKASLFDKNLNQVKKDHIRKKVIPLIEQRLAQDDLAAKIEQALRKRRAQYIKDLVAMPSTAGLMIAKVPAEQRLQMLKSRTTNFAIYQYGLEGLDDADLDTVIAAEPMTSKNSIQQFVGRILRVGSKAGKKPLVQFLEDDIGPIIGMCKIVRQQLRQWPLDEGGPYDYDLINHPTTARRMQWMNRRKLGRSSFQQPDSPT